jgi:transposase
LFLAAIRPDGGRRTRYGASSMRSSNLLRTGVQWPLLPHEYPPRCTVFYHSAQWREDGTLGARDPGSARELPL